MYYTITEVAQYFGVNETTLRYWEKEFPIIAPKRSSNKRQIRAYTTKDINNIGLVYHLLKEQGLTLDGAKEQLRKKPTETESRYEVLCRLKAIRAELAEICKHLSSREKLADNAESPVSTTEDMNIQK